MVLLGNSKKYWTAILLFCSASTLASQQASPVPAVSKSAAVLDVRDATTGYSIEAQVTFTPREAGEAAGVSARTDSIGHLRLELPSGRYLLSVISPGYEPMKSKWDTSFDTRQGIMLSGKNLPEELRPEVLEPQFRKGYILVHGYVTDADTGRPLGNVRVKLDRLGMDAITDDRGYYSESLSMPTHSPDPRNPADVVDDMTVELTGYKTTILERQLFAEPELLVKVELQRGSGVDRHDNTHVLLRGAGLALAP